MKIRDALPRAMELLDSRDRRLLWLSVIIQMATSVLDLIGILLLGLVGALAVTTVQSQPPPAAVTSVADFMGLGQASSQTLVVIFASLAAVVLLLKSGLSSYLTRRVLIFLANRQALTSARLSRELLSRPITFVQRRSSQETSYALMNGAGAATSQLLGHAVIAATEFALLIAISVTLLFINPMVAVASIVFFALIALLLQRRIGHWASRIAQDAAASDIATLNAVQEALGAYREIVVSDRRSHYVDRIQILRWQAARLTADNQFLGMIPKYVFEAALVAGGLALAGLLFSTQDSVAAVAMLALFLAASTRVLPSLMRLQGAVLGMRAAAGAALPTFALAQDLRNSTNDNTTTLDNTPTTFLAASEVSTDSRDRFTPSILLDSVSLTYPTSGRAALKDISLFVPAGSTLGLAGASGAGKSSFADVILGVLEPDAGIVRVGGIEPREAISRWPGRIAYVPQTTAVASGSIRANVALGLPDELIDDAAVVHALMRAHLWHELERQGLSLESVIGEHGLRLSGGQRQRLGLARALYTDPSLLVLDEATSALDAHAEAAITEMLECERGRMTIVVIAHRLSTLRNMDLIAYLSAGNLVGVGSFAELVDQVPAFASQASLMGLRVKDSE